jgi:dTDP-4-dehydrorhamnose reductase
VRILLFGCNGQVGWELQRSLQTIGDVVACDFDSPMERRADFTDPTATYDLVRRVNPQMVVNAAAYTAVDKAESESDLARVVNATTPGVVAEAVHDCGALLIHYSTDYVYDGSGDGPRNEDATTGPLSVYGATKLEGEDLIRASGCRHIILRTSWVYAARGHNFIKTMLRLAADRDTLSVINDQVGAPTGADLLADVTALIGSRLAAGGGAAGTYHCVASGETNWFEYARFVVNWGRSNNLPIRVPDEAITPIPTSSYRTPARRPLNSRLSTDKLRKDFSINLPEWRRGVERVLSEINGK